ncbi:MAG: excinuclease ABC subunit B, partial [Verrucomicrobiota bacterium]
MGESLVCDICGKLATVHLTQIINNKIQKVDLCEECAQQKGVTDPEGFSLSDFMAKNVESVVAPDAIDGTALICPSCGSTPRDFKRTGRLGCPSCYDAFDKLIEPLLKGMHRGSDHKGKIPHRLLHRVGLRKEINRLQNQLAHA